MSSDTVYTICIHTSRWFTSSSLTVSNCSPGRVVRARGRTYTHTSIRNIKADSHLSRSRWLILLLRKFGDLLYSSQKHLLYYTFLSVGHSLTIVTGVYFGTDGVLHRERSFLSFSLSMRCSLSPRLTFSEQLNHSRVAPPRLSQLV